MKILATIDADDPPVLHESLWWKWRSTKNGIFAVRLSQDAGTSDLTVYRDAETAEQLIEVEGTSVGWDGTLIFPAIDEETYTIRIANRPMDLWDYQYQIPSELGDGWFSLPISPTQWNEPREFLRIEVRQPAGPSIGRQKLDDRGRFR